MWRGSGRVGTGEALLYHQGRVIFFHQGRALCFHQGRCFTRDVSSSFKRDVHSACHLLRGGRGWLARQLSGVGFWAMLRLACVLACLLACLLGGDSSAEEGWQGVAMGLDKKTPLGYAPNYYLFWGRTLEFVTRSESDRQPCLPFQASPLCGYRKNAGLCNHSSKHTKVRSPHGAASVVEPKSATVV